MPLLLLLLSGALASWTGWPSWPWRFIRPLRQDPNQWSRQHQLSAEVQSLQCRPHGVAIVGAARLSGDHQHYFQTWLAIANRRAFASVHNASVYVAVQPLSDRRAMWDKPVLAEVAMQHSCPEWVWLLDQTDAFVMNITLDVRTIIDAEVHKWRNTPAHNYTQTQWSDHIKVNPYPDVLVAKDCNGINTGSLFLRNTLWTRRHLAELWATNDTDIPHMFNWGEQAAMQHLVERMPGVREHYHIVEQRLINAYPRASCGHMYKVGS